MRPQCPWHCLSSLRNPATHWLSRRQRLSKPEGRTGEHQRHHPRKTCSVNPFRTLKDVLQDVPGVQLTNEGDNRKGVSIRGLDSSYTLILIDGKRVNSRNAVFRHNDFDLNWVPVDAIERIEVVRGPMSSLYGSDATGRRG